MSDQEMDQKTSSEKSENSSNGEQEQQQTPTTNKVQIYQLKIRMKFIKPFIWRRIQVQSNITLGAFHYIIQKAMGWKNVHLHEFNKKNGRRNKTTFLPARDLEECIVFNTPGVFVDENKFVLSDVLKEPKDTISYLYDLGNDWLHDIVLEKIIELEDGNASLDSFPKCIGGKSACPPENCGGAEDYEDMLKILAGPHDKKYNNTVAWLNRVGYQDYDPTKFDPTSVIF